MTELVPAGPYAFPVVRVDEARWPEVAHVPHAGVRAGVAAALFRRAVRSLPVRIVLPSNRVLGAGGLTGPVMLLRRPRDFYRRLAAGGLIGFGESYMAGDWTAPDPAGLLTVFADRVSTLVPPVLQRLRQFYVAHQPGAERNDPANTRSNISRHYDLSNELFAQFLDPTMTYSSALFDVDDAGDPVASVDLLADAQRRKIDRLLDGCGVGDGTTVMEIGTGWGELAMRAAARGATVTSLTLSSEQKELAERRIADAGLADRITVELADYRTARGTYDAVVSVEMIEAVGYDFWDTYFATLDRLCRPGGRVGLQAITMQHERMEATKDTYTWIHKYIFPGGIIPSVRAIEKSVAKTTLRRNDRFAFGAHYARTLSCWRETFTAHADRIDALGFDETFRRMWELYLSYSEAGFRSGYIDVNQFVFAKPGA